MEASGKTLTNGACLAVGASLSLAGAPLVGATIAAVGAYRASRDGINPVKAVGAFAWDAISGLKGLLDAEKGMVLQPINAVAGALADQAQNKLIGFEFNTDQQQELGTDWLADNKVINVSILVGLCWGLALGAEGFYQGRRAYQALTERLPFLGENQTEQGTAPAELDLTPVKRGDKVAGLTVTSVFREPQRPNHNGVDVGGPVGTPYFAPATVNVRCYWDRSGGGYVAEFQYRDLLWQLLHLKAGTCQQGTQAPGAKIGEMGNTGRSTGPHLHLQLRNPDRTFIEPKRGHLLAVLQPPAPTPRDGGNTSLDALRRAIIGKESGGNFRAVNPHSGALGYGQVMPSNLPSWSRAALGREVSRQEFLDSPEIQIAIINHRLGLYLQEETGKGFDHDTAIRRVASRWYSGRAHLYNNTRPQRYGAGRYPSIHDYTLDVLRKYKAEKGG